MTEKYKTSRLVGGVNSPVRAGLSVNAEPFLASSSEGPYLYDKKGNAYIDYICGFGPIIIGHQHPTIKHILENSDFFSTLGVCNPYEESLAQLVQSANSNIDKVRFTNSGGEAVNTAVKIAKGYTQRSRILKFVGQYHGAVDSVLGYLSPSQSIKTGIDPKTSDQLVCVPFNDTKALEDAFSHNSFAAVIIEVISGNMGFIRASNPFIAKLQSLCDTHQCLLIVDEIMTGFRVGLGGTCKLYNLKPDLITYGKVVGGGFPIGAIAGPEKLMNTLSPVGPIYQAGTFSGHPISMACGVAVLEFLHTQPVFEHFDHYLKTLSTELNSIFKQKGVPFCMDHQGGMFGFYFQDRYPESYADITKECEGLFNQFYHHMRSNKILLPPSHLEAIFMTFAHDTKCLEKTLEAAQSAF